MAGDNNNTPAESETLVAGLLGGELAGTRTVWLFFWGLVAGSDQGDAGVHRGDGILRDVCLDLEHFSERMRL